MVWKYCIFTTKIWQSHSQNKYLTVTKINKLTTIVVCPNIKEQAYKAPFCQGQIWVRQASGGDIIASPFKNQIAIIDHRRSRAKRNPYYWYIGLPIAIAIYQ